MSNIEVVQDCSVITLVWERVVHRTKDDKAAASLLDVAFEYNSNGTEPDFKRSWHKACTRAEEMQRAGLLITVGDGKGRNIHYRMLTFKERTEINNLKVKHANVRVDEEFLK